MQIRAAAIGVAAGILAAGTVRAQDRSNGDAMASGLTAGDYLRFAAGVTTPVSPQGSLRDWGTGMTYALSYENWQSGGSGVGRVGFGLTAAYSALPLKDETFVSEFIPLSGGSTRSASASRAGILEITSNIRIRFPAPVVMPAITVGFGFINWAPGTIHYVASDNSTGSVKQSHRSGAELSIGGSLDRYIWDRYALFAEGGYVYGYTSYGRGFTTPGGVCSTSGCDPLKNTTIGYLRGGLRVRMGQ